MGLKSPEPALGLNIAQVWHEDRAGHLTEMSSFQMKPRGATCCHSGFQRIRTLL